MKKSQQPITLGLIQIYIIFYTNYYNSPLLLLPLYHNALPNRTRIHNGKVYFVELKTSTGTLSKSQERFKLMLEMCGFGDNWYMVRGVDEFKELINKLVK